MQFGLPLFFHPQMFELAFPDFYRYTIVFICSLHAFHFQVLDYNCVSALYTVCMHAFIEFLGMFLTQISVCYCHCGQFRGHSMLFNHWIVLLAHSIKNSVHSVLNNKYCYIETGSTKCSFCTKLGNLAFSTAFFGLIKLPPPSSFHT